MDKGGEMKEFKIEGVLSVEDDMVADVESNQWFIDSILLSETLNIHSNEIGDTIGTLKITKVEE